MPTQPLLEILDRQASKHEAQGIIGLASPLLFELVNYATQMVGRCSDVARLDRKKHFPLMLLYLNLIEAVDGIQALITESSAVPAVPIVRGAFETLLSMEYIVEADTERRALSWFAATIRDQLHYLESHDPDTP